MARLDRLQRVRAHERRSHRHEAAIRQHEVVSIAELLDGAEDVVPAAAVQPCRVVTQFVQYFVFLERGEDRLDQHRGLNAPAWDAQRVLGHLEYIVPEPSFQVAFHLRQVEVRPRTALQELGSVVEEVEAEVE